MIPALDSDDGYFHGMEVAVERGRASLEADPALPQADAGVLALVREDGRAAIEQLEAMCRAYAARPCFGERARRYGDGSSDAILLPRFATTSYGEVWRRAVALAGAWAKTGLVARGEFVGICGFASTDFVVVDIACLYLGAVSVPLQTASTPEDLRHIVEESEMKALVCSRDHLGVVGQALQARASIRSVIVMDLDPADEPGAAAVRALERPGVSIHTLRALEAIDAPTIGPAREPGAAHGERLVSILYTSGTTGLPKGASYLDRVWATRVRYGLRWPPLPVVTVGCMPLNHVMGRFNIYRTMLWGGLTHFVGRSDMSTLFEDIRLTRPTLLTLVPRVTATILQHYQSQLLLRGEDDAAREQVTTEMRSTFLGDRLCLLFTGSAATPPETIAFLKRCFGISVAEFYGFNEFGQVSTNEHVEPDVAYRLEDVPELGYSTRDRPFPRGELLVKARNPTAGYFKRPDANAHLLTPDGYMRSGDVMEERAAGHLVWIDRKHNVLKLAQGHFVSLTRLEELYASESPYLAQVHLHGSSRRAYLLAVLVADPTAAREAGASDEGHLRRLLRAELDRVARAASLPSHEIPRDFIIEPQPFTRENGLLTEAGKAKRPALKAAYGARLEALYEEIERRQLAASDGGSSPAAVIGAALGTPELDLSRSFVAMGGDSLGAVRLSSMLEARFGRAPSVAALLDPQASLAELIAGMDGRTDAAGTFREIHGAAPTAVEAAALTLDRFLPPELLRSARGARVAAPRTIVLTGASGFLGRFLLLELLERAPDARVFAIVRGGDDRAAFARLARGYRGGDALRERFGALTQAGRLVVLAGDLLRTRFGLAPAAWRSLTDEADAIVHNGALVNHALSYAQLFEPNVLGTVEAMRLALEGRSKSIAFISSSGVVAGLGRTVRESEPAGALWPRRSLGDMADGAADYAAGYATSKWAAEILLDDLARRCGVAVQILRCAMILPHRTYPGQHNEGDNIIRLLRGLLATGVAPRSFYDASVSDQHLDGLPVDAVAAGIAAIALSSERGVYHVSNARWQDGVSLDTFADGITHIGRPLVRIDDYAAWFEEFRARLERLDEPERRRSPFPILGRWARPAGPAFAIRMQNDRFRAALRSAGLPDDAPLLDGAYIARCLRALDTRLDEQPR